MIDIIKLIKGIILKNEVDQTKQLQVSVSNSATTGTTTSIVAAQTANRTITLPDSSGSLLISPGALTASRAVVTDGSGNLTTSTTTATEIGYSSGLFSNIQTQLNDKLSKSGGTMTGPIVLNGDPGAALQAAPKQYVDNTINSTAALRALSNLSSVAINSSLLPASADSITVGSSSLRYSNMVSQQLTIASGSDNDQGIFQRLTSSTDYPSFGTSPTWSLTNAVSGDDNKNLGIFTSHNTVNSSNPSGTIGIKTGNKTAGTGGTGTITIQTGNSTGGASGSIGLTTGSSTTAANKGAIVMSARWVVLPVSFVDPGTPSLTGVAGAMLYNGNNNKLYVYNGSAWKEVSLI